MGDIAGDPAPEETPSSALPLEGPDAVIGSYRLLEQIGEGGFGIVYMAEQTQPVRRRVALKVLKPGMDTRRVVARFEAERQALALMDHPNIARVFDGGATEAGRPYFVMELVRGVPITVFCDENRLSIPQRIELFVSVCKAVQHAHQKGIIHRDLKPSNVMVTMHDDRQVVKVIDFGIAKAVGQQLTEKTLFTNFALMIGTPPYMSPEQAEMSGLDVDTRSDIYALGVLLYEILTGTTPFDQERLRTVALDEVRRIIREETPPRPSTRLGIADPATTELSVKRGTDPRRLQRALQGELDWVVMKCLEKDRNRRYETANGLAMDLLHYLNHEPVRACPPSLAYRIQVFTRRNRKSLYTAGLLLAVALAGCALTVWQAIRAAAAHEAAVHAQLALSKAQRDAAEERTRAIAHDMEALNTANRLIESGRSHLVASEWAGAESDLSRALTLRPDHSSVWLSRGELYARLGMWDLADTDFRRASRLQEPGSAPALYQQALLRLLNHDKDGYRDLCARLVRKYYDPSDPKTWEKEEIALACILTEEPAIPPDGLVLMTRQASNVTITLVPTLAHATALYRAGQYESALQRLEQVRGRVRDGNVAWLDSVLAMCHHRLGHAEVARKLLESAADTVPIRLRLRSENPSVALGTPWWFDGEGQVLYEEAYRLIQGREPKDDPLVWVRRGNSFVALGRLPDAIKSFVRAVELAPNDPLAFEHRAEIYKRIGNWPAMIRDYERLVTLRSENARLNNLLAWELCSCPEPKYRDFRRATELARKAVALAPRVGNYWNTLGVALYRCEDWAGATHAVLTSMDRTSAGFPSDWLVLAMCQFRLGQRERAHQILSHALRCRFSQSEDDLVDYTQDFRTEAVALIGNLASTPAPLQPGAPEDPSAYTLLLEIEPKASWAYALRGYACGRLKHWDQAVADHARALESRPENIYWWYDYAASRLGAGDTQGYCRARADFLKRFGDVKARATSSHLCYSARRHTRQPPRKRR